VGVGNPGGGYSSRGLRPGCLLSQITPEYTLAAPGVKSIPCFTKEETP